METIRKTKYQFLQNINNRDKYLERLIKPQEKNTNKQCPNENENINSEKIENII